MHEGEHSARLHKSLIEILEVLVGLLVQCRRGVLVGFELGDELLIMDFHVIDVTG